MPRKKVRVAGAQKEGINFQVLREIKMLRGVKHAHIVVLHDVFPDAVARSLSFVFELLASDLERVLYGPGPRITPAQAKGYVPIARRSGVPQSRTRSVTGISSRPIYSWIRRGVLKLADFGYARTYPAAQRRGRCRTRRARYGIDRPNCSSGPVTTTASRWTSGRRGVFLSELFLGRPLFRGEDEVDQLARIFSVDGVPTEERGPTFLV